MKIEKKLQNSGNEKEKPAKVERDESVRQSTRYSDDDETVKISEDKKPYAAIIIAIVAVVAAAVFFLLK